MAHETSVRRETVLYGAARTAEKSRFQPGSDGEYMRGAIGIDADDHLYQAIDHYTDAAWAVKGYVEANNL